MRDTSLEPTDGDLREARRYLPSGSAHEPDELYAFACRQLAARKRLTALVDFYGEHSCRMARVHILTACAVTLGRFCGFSVAFDTIGDAVMPIGSDGEARTAEWSHYRSACRDRKPIETRDELWMAAHVADMELVRARRLDVAFYDEVASHGDDPTWLLLRQHMEMTLGARLLDRSALAGAIPYETAMAQGMATALGRIVRAGWRLLCRYAYEAASAILRTNGETGAGLISYRRAAVLLAGYSLYAWTAAPVYRRGIRMRDRGLVANDDAWPLLAMALGEGVERVDPLIVSFYSNPSRFDVRASLELRTRTAKFWAWFATLLIGQGLYETDAEQFDASFRVFRREDGSMHFVRELHIDGKLRVFDSDFVVREVSGRPTLFEVFVDHQLEVEMVVSVLDGGGLSIRGRHVRHRQVRLPRFGLQVEFTSRVVDGGGLRIDGALLMQPASKLGQFVARRILRRPKELASIRYDVMKKAEKAEKAEGSRPVPSQLVALPGADDPPTSRRK